METTEVGGTKLGNALPVRIQNALGKQAQFSSKLGMSSEEIVRGGKGRKQRSTYIVRAEAV